MRVRSLSWEHSLEEGMGTHSSVLAWRIRMAREAWQPIVHRVSKRWTRLKWLSSHANTNSSLGKLNNLRIYSSYVMKFGFSLEYVDLESQLVQLAEFGRYHLLSQDCRLLVFLTNLHIYQRNFFPLMLWFGFSEDSRTKTAVAAVPSADFSVALKTTGI